MSECKKKAVEFVVRRIKVLLVERNWTVYQLAKASGLSYTTIANITSRDTLPGIDILTIISEAFGLSLSEFFNEDLRSKQPIDLLADDERELIILYSQLPEEKKQRVKGYLECLLER